MARNVAALGFAKLARKLNRFPAEVEKQVRAAMELAAEAVCNTARNLVPVDDGKLKKSIGWTWGEAPRGSIVLRLLKGSKKKNGGLTITIYAGDSEAFYARWVEFGTAPHVNGGLFAGSANPGTSAQPFFFPAYRANKKRAKSGIRRAITKAAKKIAAS